MTKKWKCPSCGSEVEENFDLCWQCGSNPEGLKDPDFLPETEEPSKALPLCPNCLAQISPRDNFCPKCATPLTSHAAIDPIGRIYATGDTYRKAASRPTKKSTLIAMWLIFAPQIVILPNALFSYGKPSLFSLITKIFILIASTALYSAILIKVTKNYCARQKEYLNE